MNNSPHFQPHPNDKRFRDLTGRTFALLTVLGYAGRAKSGHGTWFCRCRCGKLVTILAGSLTKGATKSCGCHRSKTTTERSTKHGASHSKEYQIFNAARQRCENPKHIGYPNYGSRGIEFRFASFEEFFADLGPRPSDRHSIDRIDNDGHYEPGNVRWSLKETQAKNNRANQRITFNGRTETITDWAKAVDIPASTLYARIRNGWCEPCALTVKHRGVCPHKS
jgi:hypothetical protein